MGKYMDWKEDEGWQGVKREEERYYLVLHNSKFWITMDLMSEVNDSISLLPSTPPSPPTRLATTPP